jgi:hypothetical protein
MAARLHRELAAGRSAMIPAVEDYAAIAERCRILRGCRVKAGGRADECWCKRPDGSYAPCPAPALPQPAPDPLAPLRRRCVELGIRAIWAR